MRARRRTKPRADHVLGARGLERFDVCIVGSGAGGGTAAHVLTAAGKTVLVLEAGNNGFPGLDADELPPPTHSNDELKYAVRGFIEQSRHLEPRTFRQRADRPARVHPDVNLLPKTVGGAWVHADVKVPRFAPVDFRMVSAVREATDRHPGLAVPGFGTDAASASFVDWPVTYEEMEPFYEEAEMLLGVQGSEDNPYVPARATPFPMPSGAPMYFGLVLAAAAGRTPFGGEPIAAHTYPGAQNSRPYDGRPPCNDCGFCSGFGCPIHAKGSVSALRKALRSGRCQLRYNAQVLRLINDGGHVSGVEYADGDGEQQVATADCYVLAASPIESARLCLLSREGGLGNSSDAVGRNLMFHFQTNVNGFLPERVHGQRGKAVTHGFSDFRGLERGGARVRILDDGSGPRTALGGVVEFGAPQGLPITEDGMVYVRDLPGPFGARYGQKLRQALKDAPLGQHLLGLIMQGEDAPQPENRVELDPTVRDVFGCPVPMVTYRTHAFERETRRFCIPYMKQVLENAGAANVFVAPAEEALGGPATSRHVLGTLRMGTDPGASVTRPDGRFHDVDNLYACDGSVFPTSGGWNPTLTIVALAIRTARGIAAA